MTRILIDDGMPEAEDYDSSYVSFDEEDLGSMKVALTALEQAASHRPGLHALTIRWVRDCIARKEAVLERGAAVAPRTRGRLPRVRFLSRWHSYS